MPRRKNPSETISMVLAVMCAFGDLQLMAQRMLKPSLSVLKAPVFSRTWMPPFLVSRPPPSFSLFLTLWSQENQKMTLLREQLVTSACKIETGKVSPPAQLPSDCSHQTFWASITFRCISRLHHQQGDEALGDIFLCPGAGTITGVPFGFT